MQTHRVFISFCDLPFGGAAAGRPDPPGATVDPACPLRAPAHCQTMVRKVTSSHTKPVRDKRLRRNRKDDLWLDVRDLVSAGETSLPLSM